MKQAILVASVCEFLGALLLVGAATATCAAGLAAAYSYGLPQLASAAVCSLPPAFQVYCQCRLPLSDNMCCLLPSHACLPACRGRA